MLYGVREKVKLYLNGNISRGTIFGLQKKPPSHMFYLYESIVKPIQYFTKAEPNQKPETLY